VSSKTEVFTIITLKIVSKDNEEKFFEKGIEINTCYDKEFEPGDKICISTNDTEFIGVKLDETLAESIIYIPSKRLEFTVPFGDLKAGYDPQAFEGNSHRIRVYEPSNEEKYSTRLISLNSLDQRGQKRYFPHA